MGIFSSDEEPSWEDIYNLQANKVMLELKIDKLEAENDRLKTCLQEIKEIAERGFNNSQCNCGLRADIDQIIQKITKAENEDNQ